MRLRYVVVVLLAVLVLGSTTLAHADDVVARADASARTTDAPVLPDGIDLAQTIELVLEPFPMLAVSLLSQSSNTGLTTYSVPSSWGGVRDTGDEVHGVRVTGPDGVDRGARRTRSFTWEVTAPPGEVQLLSYHLVPARYRIEAGNPYRPIIKERLVHLIGETAFLGPDHLDDDTKRSFELRWAGFAERGWKVASSFGLAPGSLRFTATMSSWRHAVYLAAPDLVVTTKTLQGGPVAVALAEPSTYAFSADEFAELTFRVIEAERAFFPGDVFPFFLVTAIPVAPPDPEAVSLGGTGLSPAFALFLQRGTSLAPGSRTRLRLVHLVAHEHFHTWNGRIIGRVEPEELVYWFSEGFTDYFTRRILYRSGLLTGADYCDYVNRATVAWLASPVRNEPATRIQKDFWNDVSVEKLPYDRGAVVALLVDGEIRRLTKGTKSLDDMMHEVVERARATGEKVSNPMLIDLISRWTSPLFAETVRTIVVDGADPPPLPPDFEPGLAVKLETATEWTFDLGFDFAGSRSGRTVRGVREGGPAWAAGLRDGQRLRGWSVSGLRTDIAAEFDVAEGSSERKVTYLPRGSSLAIPRYELEAP